MSSTAVSPSYGLYDYQRQVMLDTIASINRPRGMMEPYPRVLLHLPTGAGKTRIATHLVCELLNRGGPRFIGGLVGIRHGTLGTGRR